MDCCKQQGVTRWGTGNRGQGSVPPASQKRNGQDWDAFDFFRFLGFAIAAFFILHSASCGVKAPPLPRELVVPAPVKDVAVAIVPDGLEITFTLPSKSLDGSPLEVIGGYRISREGPDGKVVREDVRFSVSEMRQMAGNRVVFLDDPPEQAGTYRYCVIPVDVYGSRPSRRQTGDLCWEGLLSDTRPTP